MKKSMLLIILLMTTQFVAASSIYDCAGGSFDPVKIEVLSSTDIIVNDKERGQVIEKSPKLGKLLKVYGSFRTLGDGLEGYRVDVKVSSYMFTGSQISFLKTFNRGPDGYFADSYKCIKR